ncbi:hypothetical protein FOB97_00085 [Shigella flexneri]|nr:hypothetical protein FOB97_00085 [Shigella flexneri]
MMSRITRSLSVEYLEKYADFTTNLARNHRMTWRTTGTSPLMGEAMPSPVGDEGFITIRSILPAMTLLMTNGRVINALRQSNVKIRGYLYLDHGEMMGAHKLISKGAAMYDDITRIRDHPFAARGAATGRYASQSY